MLAKIRSAISIHFSPLVVYSFTYDYDSRTKLKVDLFL